MGWTERLLGGAGLVVGGPIGVVMGIGSSLVELINTLPYCDEFDSLFGQVQSSGPGVLFVAALPEDAEEGGSRTVSFHVEAGGAKHVGILTVRGEPIKLEDGSVGPWASFPMRRCHRR